jgi:hypothetical protein
MKKEESLEWVSVNSGKNWFFLHLWANIGKMFDLKFGRESILL